MILCTETITILNPKVNPKNGDLEYYPSIIDGCSWFEKTLSAVTDNGLKAANETVIRIPASADFHGKDYVEPGDFEGSDPTQSFTLDSQALIVKGQENNERITKKELKQIHSQIMTVLGVTDNRRAKLKHWKVICK